jgi:hypothetical protein
MPEPEIKVEENNEIGNSGIQNPPPVVEQPKVEKVTLTPEELEARIQKEASALIEAEKEVARKEEARKQGDFKTLYENEQAARRKAELSAWRTKALAKHSLSEDWYDSLSGETEEDVMKAAKAIKKRIDEAIENQQHQLLENGIPSGSKKQPVLEKKRDGKDITRRNLALAFNIGGLPRSR